jgi:15-cis-phytoene synthase
MADLAAIVRTSAWDRYISTLFAPAEKRDALFALYAFDAEVARIALLVHDPLPGEIRLQWWRDVANGTRDAEAQGHPVATTLLQTIKDHNLPRSAFDTYCDARIFDFYHDAMPDQTALEAYLGATHSAFIQLACLIVDKDAARQAADASGHAGVALGTAAIIQQLPRTRSRSQCYVPADILNACGLDSDAFIKGDNKSAIKNAIDALCELGLSHVTKWQAAAKALPPSLKSVFLPIYNARRILEKAKLPAQQPAFAAIELSQLRRLYGITRAALK